MAHNPTLPCTFLLFATAALLFSFGSLLGSVKLASAQRTTVPLPPYMAVASFLLNTSNPLVGVSGAVSVESPRVVRSKDNSFGGIALLSADQNAPLDYSVLLNVGYMVFPARNGNNTPRLYVQYFNIAPNGKITGCIDTDCPGFVKTERKGLLGSELHNKNSKEILRQPERINVKIQQNHTTKNWEVFFEGTKLGYWPNHLFTGAGKRGINVAGVGGITVDSTGDTTPASEMGSGRQGFLPNQLLVASITDVELVEARSYRVINVNDQGLSSTPVRILRVVTNPICYSVSFLPALPFLTNSATFYYGGPGCSI